MSGSGFGSGATALWNGKALPTAVAGDSQLTASVPAALIASSGTAAIAVTTSAGVSNTLAFPIAPPTPVVSANGIVNALSSLPSIAPGSLISIWGTNSSSHRHHARSPRAGRQFHRGHFRDRQRRRRAPSLCQPHPHQCATALRGSAGASARLVVDAGGAKSAPALFPVNATAPGVSVLSTNAASPNHAVAVNYADGTLNGPDHPAAPGQYVILYLTGQGGSR